MGIVSSQISVFAILDGQDLPVMIALHSQIVPAMPTVQSLLDVYAKMN